MDTECMSEKPISPKLAYYIKLGRHGEWEKECITETQTLRLGYNSIPDDLCRQGKWDEIHENFKKEREDLGAATRDRNQVRSFYEADENVLWVTFYGERLYWCFSAPEITLLPDKTKVRHVIGRWSCTDIHGEPLQESQLSGYLLRMRGFRGTICKVKEIEYLVRKINGDVQPEVEEVLKAKAELESRIETLIRKLSWKDFELLIDLLFRQAGWQRLSELGKTKKDIDIDLEYPLTGDRFYVQVKSSANLSELQNFSEKLKDYQDYERAYFIVHTPSRDLAQAQHIEDIEVWLPNNIAHQVVLYGLTDWVINKVT